MAYVFDDTLFPCGSSDGCGINDLSGPSSGGGGSIFVDALTGRAPGTGDAGSYTTANGTSRSIRLTNVKVSTLNSNSNALSGFDTAILFQTCKIGTAGNAPAMSAINAFLQAGKKVMIFDADACANASAAKGAADWSNFVFPFNTNSPGPKGGVGSYTKIEASPLTNGLTIGTQPGDSVGDANIFRTFDGRWFQAIVATNTNGANGIVEAYARTASGGIAIYSGEDFWFATRDAFPHLRLVFDNILNQTWNPDELPSTISASGITLTPPIQTVPVGTAFVTATVTDTNSIPKGGIEVTLKVLSGNGGPATQTVVTGSNGQAKFPVTSLVGGEVTVSASFRESFVNVHESSPAKIVFTVSNPLGTPGRYVALGDSFSSGEGNPPFVVNGIGTDTDTNRCHRSDQAYGPLIQKDRQYSDFVFRACSGAIVADLVASIGGFGQWGEGKQLDAISPAGTPSMDTRLVTLSISGNDLFFPQVLDQCVNSRASILHRRTSGTCARAFEALVFPGLKLLREGGDIVVNTDGGPGLPTNTNPAFGYPTWTECRGKCPADHGTFHKVTVPRLSDIFKQIHDRAPNAEIRVLLYPDLFPAKPTENCLVGTFPGLFPPITSTQFEVSIFNMNLLNSGTLLLNQEIIAAVRTARSKGITAVGVVRPAFAGHGLCGSEGSWFNGVMWSGNLITDQSPLSFHPSTEGQRAFARAIEDSLCDLCSRPR